MHCSIIDNEYLCTKDILIENFNPAQALHLMYDAVLNILSEAEV